MVKYRICKNKHGYYKAQQWKPFHMLLFIIPILARWTDAGFHNHQNTCIKSQSKVKIQKMIDGFHRENGKAAGGWKCDGEYDSPPISKVTEFLTMLLDTINGGGRVVTFMDQDIKTLKEILDEEEHL